MYIEFSYFQLFITTRIIEKESTSEDSYEITCCHQYSFISIFQGVGKNKIADRFLNLLNCPREYIQLHRFVI